uniref:GDSL esterase/lipase n=1 Tax=Chenopodium quinoa TaxID=63459 RepID=A0A803KTE4_CHEQI
MLISLSMLSNHRSYGAEEQIANFVFGDSDVDVGNNNYIVSLLKANSMPNGIDYEGPTGRFTNGRTVIDIIGKLYIHEYCTISSVVFLYVFLRFKDCRLYNMGARKILVTNVPQIGCTPFERRINLCSGNQCAAYPNQLAQLYNVQLKSLLTELNSNLKGSKFLYGDAYGIFTDFVYNYRSYGVEIIGSPCCHNAGVGSLLGDLIPCNPTSSVCSDRSKYAFWDPVHPTEATITVIAKRLIDGNITDISPINVRQLLSS